VRAWQDGVPHDAASLGRRRRNDLLHLSKMRLQVLSPLLKKKKKNNNEQQKTYKRTHKPTNNQTRRPETLWFDQPTEKYFFCREAWKNANRHRQNLEKKITVFHHQVCCGLNLLVAIHWCFQGSSFSLSLLMFFFFFFFFFCLDLF
jgi:hypothetical protein